MGGEQRSDRIALTEADLERAHADPVSRRTLSGARAHGQQRWRAASCGTCWHHYAGAGAVQSPPIEGWELGASASERIAPNEPDPAGPPGPARLTPPSGRAPAESVHRRSRSMSGRRLARPLAFVAIVVALGAALWFATRPPPLTVQGEVDAHRADVSARVSGRVHEYMVDVGDTVEPGAVIARLESPQLEAALAVAEAALVTAQADLDRINNTQPQVIAARKAELAQADAEVTLAGETHKRQVQLVRSHDTPQARLDEATRDLETALRKRESADAELQLAIRDATAQTAVANANIKQAEATVEQWRTDQAELTIHAPIHGQVTTRIAELGENFGVGAPLFSIVDLEDEWFTFNLREDLLGGLKVGDEFTVTVPAMRNAELPLRVTVINAQGQFATWRATRATGDFDLRTFEVRAKPITPQDGLRPGMSGIAAWDRREAGSR
jgi:HlyD family secretion protein